MQKRILRLPTLATIDMWCCGRWVKCSGSCGGCGARYSATGQPEAPPAAVLCTAESHAAIKADETAWRALPAAGLQPGGGMLLELRLCTLCRSTLALLIYDANEEIREEARS